MGSLFLNYSTDNNFCKNILKEFLFYFTIALFIFLSIYYLGINNCIALLIWWLFFSCFHYVLYHDLKCPVALTPPLAMSAIILITYLGGIFGSLYYGYYLVLLISVYGFLKIVIYYKSSFFNVLLYQPYSLQLFYFLGFILFLHNYYFSTSINHVDDLHHWAWIVNGMCHYNTLSGFPRLAMYDNYTLGEAIWCYFINKLSLSTFKIFITYWANSLISAICFVPGLAFFDFSILSSKQKTSILLIICLLILCLLNSYIYTSIALIFYIVILLLSSSENKLLYLTFSSYLIWWLIIMVQPGYNESTYRNLPPDHIIAIVSSIFIASYLARPKTSTLYYSIPFLSLVYLFKRPGLFYSIAVGSSILIVFFTEKLYLLLKNCKYRNIKYLITTFVALSVFILSLSLPVLVWKNYCKNTTSKPAFKLISDYNGIKNIYIDATDKSNLKFKKTVANFYTKFLNEELFLTQKEVKNTLKILSYYRNKIQNILLSREDKPNDNLLTYPVLLISIAVFNLLLLFFCSKKRFLLFWFVNLILFLFAIFHIFGTVIVYYFAFLGKGAEETTIPVYQRYLAVMPKILVMSSLFYVLFLYKNIEKKKIKIFLCVSFCLFSFLSFLLFDKSAFLNTTDTRCLDYVKAIVRQLPKDFDFKNKKIAIFRSSNVLDDLRRPNLLGMICMLYPYSSPKSITFLDSYNKIDLSKFNYLWLMQEDDSDNSISITNKIINKIDIDYSLFKAPALLEINEINNIFSFNLVYKDFHSLSNIINNSFFENDLSYWKPDNFENYSLQNLNYFKTFYPSIKLGPKKKIYQNVNLSKGHYYRIYILSKNYNDYNCGTLTYIRNNKTLYINLPHVCGLPKFTSRSINDTWCQCHMDIFSDCDQIAKIEIKGDKYGNGFLTNIRVIDMGDWPFD